MIKASRVRPIPENAMRCWEMFYNSHKNKEKKAIPSSYMHGINDSVNVEN